MKISLTILLLLQACASAQIEPGKLKLHVDFLSSDSLEGRGTGKIGGEKAALYIVGQFQNLKLTPKGTDGYLQKFPFRTSASPHGADTTQPEQYANNVVGFLDNGRENTIIIGAHYDHLGLGEQGGSLDPNPKGKIHNGADDNASGVAGVIEFARYFSNNQEKEKYNFLFICFSGEELGLLGSKAFTQNPMIDLTKAQVMINMDMVGRLDSAKHLMVYGTGTSPELEGLVKNLNPNFQLKLDSSGIGPSDHTSFYLKNIPVLHFFTGSHIDYHKPSDDADRINYAGQKEVLDYIALVIHKIDLLPKLAFLPTRNNNNENTPRFKVTLGILPDYSFSDGLRVDGVTEGKPASRAGLKQGDIITQLGAEKVTDMQSYMKALSKFSKGDKTKLRFKRGTSEVESDVTF